MKSGKDLLGFQIGLKFKVLWLSLSTAILLWFSYWIFYDVSVWSKRLDQLGSVNIVGVVLSLALILSGVFAFKFNGRKRVGAKVEVPEPKPATVELPVKSAQVSQEVDQPPKPSDVQGCLHFLGYLRKRERSETIPNECLTCKKVISCMSSDQ